MNCYRRRFLSTEERFADRVHRTDGCWNWTGATSADGLAYGIFWLNGRNQYAHRAAYEFVHGRVPVGKCVLHHCDNPRCVRLDHLWLGTISENNHDRATKGRNRDQRGERNSQAKLTVADISLLRRAYARGDRQRSLARQYGITQTAVSKIVRGLRWRLRSRASAR